MTSNDRSFFRLVAIYVVIGVALVLTFAALGCGGNGSVQDEPATGVGSAGQAFQDPRAVARPLSPQPDELALIDVSNAARGEPQGTWCGPTDTREAAAYPPGPRLLVDEVLVASARAHARAMADEDNLEHQTEEKIKADGGLAENIGMLGAGMLISSGDAAPGIPWDETFSSPIPRPVEVVPDQLVEGWVQSAGHCHNLLSHRWTHMGASFALSEDTKSWYGVQIFGEGQGR